MTYEEILAARARKARPDAFVRLYSGPYACTPSPDFIPLEKELRSSNLVYQARVMKPGKEPAVFAEALKWLFAREPGADIFSEDVFRRTAPAGGLGVAFPSGSEPELELKLAAAGLALSSRVPEEAERTLVGAMLENWRVSFEVRGVVGRPSGEGRPA